MLGNKDAAANIAVKDLEVAKIFYGETLGLTQVGSEGDELIVFRSGNSMITSIDQSTLELTKPRL